MGPRLKVPLFSPIFSLDPRKPVACGQPHSGSGRQSYLAYPRTTNTREAGYEVEVAEDGDQAIRSITARCPAVAIVDINMPGTDGFGVLTHAQVDGAPL